jgi:hypothetical protein
MKQFNSQRLFFIVVFMLTSSAFSQDISYDYNDNYMEGEDLQRKWNFLNNNSNNNNGNDNGNDNVNKEQNDDNGVLRSADTYIDSQENTSGDEPVETVDENNNKDETNSSNNNSDDDSNNGNKETVKVAGGIDSKTYSGTVSLY